MIAHGFQCLMIALLLVGPTRQQQQEVGRPEDLTPIKSLINRGEYAEARKLLGPLIENGKSAGETRYLMGLVEFLSGNHQLAIKHLQLAAEQSPRDTRPRKLLAAAFVVSNRKAEAEALLSDIIRNAPGDAEGWSLLGRLYQDSQRFNEALKPLEKALHLNPSDSLALHALAFTYVGLGDYERAVVTFRKAVGANERSKRPSSVPHASFAILLLRLDRVPEAGKQVEKAIALNPLDPLTLQAQRALEHRLNQGVAAALSPKRQPFTSPKFEDVALKAGLGFRLENSPTLSKHQIETMPGGVAVLDFDNDGWMDIYFTNGAESPSLRKSDSRFWNRLYRNNGDLTFTDVTERAGVKGRGYMMGAAAADFDNDGYPDLFVVGVDCNLLYRNNRDGTFSDVTSASNLAAPHPQHGRMWGIHGAWLDYDNDGWLDLLVVNYCAWDPRTEPHCGGGEPGERSYCHPRHYRPLPNQLFRNNRDGTFKDVSHASGVGRYNGKGMGAAIADYDGDGRIDLFVANDTEPNFFFRNTGGGKFEEIATQIGAAYNQFGIALSSMGADFRDVNNDGRPDLFVTALSNEGFLLLRNSQIQFDDVSDRSGISLVSLPVSGWSNAIADFDNDGRKDLFSANGHALDNVAHNQSRAYRQRNSIFQNVTGEDFRDVSEIAGADFQRVAAHRGAGVADFDNDGRLDLVVTALGDRAELFHNRTPSTDHWIIIRLSGHASNRDGLGAVLKLVTSDGRVLWNQASTSVGYASSSDPRVHFGLGEAQTIKSLEILWPSGRRQMLKDLRPDRILTVEEPK